MLSRRLRALAATRAAALNACAWRVAARGAMRALATDAKAAAGGAKKAEEPDADKPEAKAKDPAAAAARKAKRAARRAEVKAKKLAELNAGTGNAPPSYLEPANPKKRYLGTRAAVDTERTIDRRRFRIQMSEIRVRYAAEYAEKKAAADEEIMRRTQAMLVDKAERLRERFARQREAKEEHDAAEVIRLRRKDTRMKIAAAVRLDREKAQRNRRAYQREVLRAERRAGQWVEDFDAQIGSGEAFFESQARPQGFWPAYSQDRTTSWERAATFAPPPPRSTDAASS